MSPVAVAVTLSQAMLGVALLLCVYRLVRGPSLPDRVVALDLLVSIIVGLIACQTLRVGQGALLRPATVLALLAFLGTVAFARYIERRARCRGPLRPPAEEQELW